MGDLTTNFSLSEFLNKNDYGPTFKTKTPKAELVATLQALRDEIKMAIGIESGIRSVEHNKSVGGAASSAHLMGEAADIYVTGMKNTTLGRIIRVMYNQGRLPYLAYTYLIKGTSNTRVHVGVDLHVKRNSVFGDGYEKIA